MLPGGGSYSFSDASIVTRFLVVFWLCFDVDWSAVDVGVGTGLSVAIVIEGMGSGSELVVEGMGSESSVVSDEAGLIGVVTLTLSLEQ